MRILVDCDGVLSNFIDHVLVELNDICGTKHVIDDVTEWEMYEALKVPGEARERVDEIVMSPGFCAYLPTISGAREALDQLRADGHQVRCLTTPFKGDNWMPERVHWLRKHMGFNRKEVIFCHEKEYEWGDVLVDDKIENLQAWQARHPLGKAILFVQPWNKSDDRWQGARADDWRDVLRWVIQLAGTP